MCIEFVEMLNEGDERRKVPDILWLEGLVLNEI